MGIEDYLQMEVKQLRVVLRLLKELHPEMYATLLANSGIKRKIIVESGRYDFIWLVQEESDDMIERLLDEEGISYLSQAPELITRLNGLLTCDKNAVNHFFRIPSFCDLIFQKIDALDGYLYTLQAEGAILFVNYAMEQNCSTSQLRRIICNFSSETMTKVVEKVSLPFELTKSILISGSKKSSEYILKHDSRIQDLSFLSFHELYILAEKGVFIPHFLLSKKTFQQKISHLSNIKAYRFLMNALETRNDVEEIEEQRKGYYEEELQSYQLEERMLKKHLVLFQKLVEGMKKKTPFWKFQDFLAEFCQSSGENSWNHQIWSALSEFYNHQDVEGLRTYFQEESNLELTNLLIDYHFREISYNFFLNLRQLCQFQATEGRTLSDEELAIYQKILELDQLPYEEKMKLHQELLKKDYVSKFYDDYRTAKDKASTLMQQQMLTKEKASIYLREDLSKEAGVPIYVLEGEPFLAFVKSLSIPKSYVLHHKDIVYTVDGSSYSLDGNSKLSTFQDPREFYNVAYTTLPIHQIIHVYPVDSYSKYIRSSNSPATNRVYRLSTPKELVTESMNYSEILVAQRNDAKKDELNLRLEVPEMFAIYCYDEITENDIESAKNLGLGILLVKTKSYQRSSGENTLKLFDTTGPDGYKKEFDYIERIDQDEMYGRRK